MVTRNKNTARFISDTIHLCSEHSVEFKLVASSKVPLGNKIYCNGYFWANSGADNSHKLVVATKKPIKEWLPILVHESCHLDQYIENPNKFVEDDCIDRWLNGEKVYDKDIRKGISASKRLELDCEKRTVRKIKKYNLPIDVKEYIQKSNLYIHFYNWVYLNRRWVPKGKTLYTKPLYSLMNTSFDKSYGVTSNYILNAISNEFNSTK